MKKKETIFIASILVIAGILWLGFRISGRRSHNTIRITVDGKEFGTYSLSKDQVIHIGDTNVCEIKDGKVTMIEATCPDHYCHISPWAFGLPGTVETDPAASPLHTGSRLPHFPH